MQLNYGLDALFLGHDQVRDEKLERFSLSLLHSLLPIGRSGHHVPSMFQESSLHRKKPGVVIDQKYLCHKAFVKRRNPRPAPRVRSKMSHRFGELIAEL